jgi:hypothetical protein
VTGWQFNSDKNKMIIKYKIEKHPNHCFAKGRILDKEEQKDSPTGGDLEGAYTNKLMNQI